MQCIPYFLFACLLFNFTCQRVLSDDSDKVAQLLEKYKQRKEPVQDNIVSDEKTPIAEEDLPIDLEAIEEEASVFKELFIVTGTKQKRKILESPFTVFVLDKERIKTMAANDVGEILAAMPGLDLFRVNDRIANIGPPGFATGIANQYLVLIDNVPFPTRRGGGIDVWSLPLTVDQIERIEYLPGPQTTLYGSNAAVGVINIITTRAKPDSWDKKKPSGLSARVGGDSFARYDTFYNFKEGDLATSVWTSFRESDGYGNPVDSFALQPLTRFDGQEDSDNQKAGCSLVKELGQNRSLRYDFSYFTGTRSPIIPMTEGPAEEHRQHINSTFTYQDAPNADDSFTITLKNFNENVDFTNFNTAFYASPGEQDEYEDTRLEIRRQFKDKGGRRFTLGGDYEHIQAAGVNFGMQEHNLYENSLNVLTEIPLQNKQSLFVGLNHYHSSQAGNELTYKVQLRKELTKREVIRAGYGTGVRGPDLVALYTTDYTATFPNPFPPPPVITQDIVNSNPNLEMEEFDFAELSYERRTDCSNVQARLFFGHSKNIVGLRETGAPPIDLTAIGSGIVTPIEIANDPSEVEYYGFTAAWDKRFNDMWRTLVTWRYLNTDREDGSENTYSPANHINFTATYRPTKKASFNLTTRTYSSYETFSTATAGGHIDGYTVLDLAFTHSFTKDKSHLGWIKVTNATDRRIIEGYPTASLPPSPGWYTGRRITLGYGFRF